jgi:enoyl-CoA hydratase
MLLGGEGLDATRAAEVGLVLRVATGEGADGRSAAVTEALRMASTSAAAPRELVVATKASVRATGALTRHRDAVEVEVGPQLDSLNSEGFRAGLERVRSATKNR